MLVYSGSIIFDIDLINLSTLLLETLKDLCQIQNKLCRLLIRLEDRFEKFEKSGNPMASGPQLTQISSIEEFQAFEERLVIPEEKLLIVSGYKFLSFSLMS